ncbi:MAG: twin-arginine translocase TatA/TatE family subunit [Solirubrobacteraceae bacterium]|jgi:sec-independent protein translocase protein TatA
MGLENPVHILILLVVVLLVFGARRLPELGHSLGSGMRGFKDALSGEGPHASLTVVTDEQARVAANPAAVTAPAPASPGAPKARS